MELMSLIVVVSALVIYWDCTRNHIGKIPGEKSFLNNSAGVWAVGTCLLWIVVFPLYLVNRKKLQQKAVDSPQIVSSLKRSIVLGFFFLCSILVVVGQFSTVLIPDSNTLLSDVSGVWKAADDTIVIVNIENPKAGNLQIEDTIIPVRIDQVDVTNQIVVMTVMLNDGAEVWTIRKVILPDESFWLMLSKADGTQFQLTFVRNIQ